MLCPDCNNYQTMSDKFQNKYRIPSARLKNWDYGRNAAYFVTICTQNRISWFGEIKIRTDAMHCVSAITGTNEPNRTDAMHCVSTVKNPIQPNKSINQFGPQSKNLASIIRGFKTGVTKNARVIHPDFAWQSRFHDRIIRNNAEYQRISTYIKNNPAHWQDDKFFMH